MAIAKLLSRDSHCHSRQVGCLIVSREGHVISSGVNGEVPFPKLCRESCHKASLNGGGENCPAVHAEVAAILAAGRPLHGATLITSDIVPCKDCLIALYKAGIIRVVCDRLELYDRLSAEILRNCGFTVCTPDLKRLRTGAK